LNQVTFRRKKVWIAIFFVIQLSIIAIWSVDSKAQLSGSWKFAVLCDTRGDSNPLNLEKSGVNEVVVTSAAKDIVKEGAELVLVPGDLVNGFKYIKTPYASQFATWRKAMAPVYDAGIKVYPVRGNHETGPYLNNEQYPWPPVEKNNPMVDSIPELKAAFLGAFNDPWIPANGPEGEKRLTYSFSNRNAFFVGVDEYVNPIKVNQGWLDAELNSNKLPHVFVYGHDPAFRVTHTDSLASYPQDRDTFWDSLGKAGVRMYFCGHDHFYNRAHIKDRVGNVIYQVLPGSGGAPFSKWQPQQYAEGEKVVNDYHDEEHYGYVLVTVDDAKVTMEWKALFKEGEGNTWRAIDTLQYSLQAH
jgi:hypothetical protein